MRPAFYCRARLSAEGPSQRLVLLALQLMHVGPAGDTAGDTGRFAEVSSMCKIKGLEGSNRHPEAPSQHHLFIQNLNQSESAAGKGSLCRPSVFSP